jgi:hypothetical protein
MNFRRQLLGLLVQARFPDPLDYHERTQRQRKEDEQVLEETFHLP